jgi:hypothetical protein
MAFSVAPHERITTPVQSLSVHGGWLHNTFIGTQSQPPPIYDFDHHHDWHTTMTTATSSVTATVPSLAALPPAYSYQYFSSMLQQVYHVILVIIMDLNLIFNQAYHEPFSSFDVPLPGYLESDITITQPIPSTSHTNSVITTQPSSSMIEREARLQQMRESMTSLVESSGTTSMVC